MSNGPMQDEAEETAGEARLAAAVRWHVRLSDDAEDRDWQEFTAWLEADPGNRLAYDEVELLVGELGELRADLAGALAGGDAPDDEVKRPAATVVPLRRPPAAAAALPRSRRGALIAGFAMAASLALAVGLWQRAPDRPAAPVAALYQTEIGGLRDVVLADGSRLHLNTATRVAVTLGERERRVVLSEGEALFEVAPDPARPFIVVAGDETVRAVGTAFNVLRHAGAVTVTVSHGIVEVRPLAASAARSGTANSWSAARLGVGQQHRREEGAPIYTIARVDAEAVTAWRSRRLVYEARPLAEVVSDLNRYFATRISLEAGAVHQLRFSGVLVLDGEASVLHRLEQLLPVAVERTGDAIVLRGQAR